MRLPRRRVLLAALPLVLVTGVALAAQPGGRQPSSAVINACVKKKDRPRPHRGRRRLVPSKRVVARLEQPGGGRAGRRAGCRRPAGPGRSRRAAGPKGDAGVRRRRRAAAGPAGPTGPAGPAGPSLPSLESLNGVGCHLAGAPELPPLTYDANGVATLNCAPPSGGSTRRSA